MLTARPGDLDGLLLATLLHDFELNVLALAQGAEAWRKDGRLVDKQVLVLALSGCDEAEALLGVEPLDGANHFACARCNALRPLARCGRCGATATTAALASTITTATTATVAATTVTITATTVGLSAATVAHVIATLELFMHKPSAIYKRAESQPSTMVQFGG
uniref:Uncharacterized protein n=1 Tax=Haptolina ericina TaxID=156174 RepID=A0A7S3AL51_9EUKA